MTHPYAPPSEGNSIRQWYFNPLLAKKIFISAPQNNIQPKYPEKYRLFRFFLSLLHNSNPSFSVRYFDL